MARTVVGLFPSFGEAENVIGDLVNAGFERDAISVIANDYTGEYALRTGQGGGMTAGAGAGAAIGGVAGLIISLGALAIPGIGPIVAAGPLAAALTGAGIGAAAGGLMGALVSMGVPEEEAHAYAEGVRRGGALLTVRCDDTMADTATDIMERHGALNVEERADEWRKGGWVAFNPAGEPYQNYDRERATGTSVQPAETQTGNVQVARRVRAYDTAGSAAAPERPEHEGDFQPAQTRFDESMTSDEYVQFEPDFRNNFETTLRGHGYTYAEAEPAYRYGYGLATDRRYGSADWSAIETDARRNWENGHPGAWERFKDAIRYGWERVRSHSHVS